MPLLILGFITMSCGSAYNGKQNEKIRALTTKQFDADSKQVFNIILDILKQDNIQINSVNENVGIISARSSDRVPAGVQMLNAMVVGSTTDRFVYNYSFYVKELEKNKAEVKLLIHQTSYDKDFSGVTTTETSSEGLLKSKKLYNYYFDLIQRNLN